MSIAWLSKCWPLQVGNSTSVQKSGGAVSGATARKLVLIVLADYADEDGYCWPSARTIATRTELSDRATRKALTTLEEDGYLEIQEDFELAGRQTSNVYRIVIPQSPLVSGTRGRVHLGLGEGASGTTSTRTVSRTVSKNRENGSGKPRRMNTRPDDDSEPADESPSLGKGRTRESRPARKEREERKGTTTFGLVLRLKRQLEEAGYSAPVNESGLTKAIGTWNLPHATVEKMLELFASNPRSYLRGNEVPWTGLVRQREVLKADASKMVEAEDPTAKFRAG